MPEALDFDLCIVGAGPAGLYAAFYAGLRRLKVALIDALPFVGGQITALYPNEIIYDIPGHPAVRGSQLVEQLRQQTGQFSPTIRLAERVLQLEEQATRCILHTDRATLSATYTVLATGVGQLVPRHVTWRTPPIALASASHVFSQVPVGGSLKSKQVILIGGTGRSVEEVKVVQEVAASAILAWPEHPARPSAPESAAVRPVRKIEVDCLTDKEMVAYCLEPADGWRPYRCDALILSAGFDVIPAQLVGPTKAAGAPAIVMGSTMGCQSRIYAIGDAATYDGKLKLIANGFAEAAVAVNHIAALHFPSQRFFPGHSTSTVPRRLTQIDRHFGEDV